MLSLTLLYLSLSALLLHPASSLEHCPATPCGQLCLTQAGSIENNLAGMFFCIQLEFLC